MGFGYDITMQPRTALKLGRVSNLPTVWTNCLVGFALAGINPEILPLLLVWLAFSLFYIAGMFLNDVFDYEWDKNNQPDRPIVAGEASREEVVVYSVFMLVIGILCILFASADGRSLNGITSVFVLIACILLYDWKHKDWVHSSWLMGCCRLLIYWTVALTASSFSLELLLPGICLMGYIAGITYLARAEHLNSVSSWWPLGLIAAPVLYGIFLAIDSPVLLLAAIGLALWLGSSVKILSPGVHRSVPKAISQLIAGICLIDALILAGMSHYILAGVSVIAFFVTLLFQKNIKAT